MATKYVMAPGTVLVKPVDMKTAGGIVLPGGKKEDNRGTIVAVANERRVTINNARPSMYSASYEGWDAKFTQAYPCMIDGEDFLVVDEDNIMVYLPPVAGRH
jgi:co-chaperonin GroES (HSP10)